MPGLHDRETMAGSTGNTTSGPNTLALRDPHKLGIVTEVKQFSSSTNTYWLGSGRVPFHFPVLLRYIPLCPTVPARIIDQPSANHRPTPL